MKLSALTVGGAGGKRALMAVAIGAVAGRRAPATKGSFEAENRSPAANERVRLRGVYAEVRGLHRLRLSAELHAG